MTSSSLFARSFAGFISSALTFVAACVFFTISARGGLVGADINGDPDLMSGNYMPAATLFTYPLFNQPSGDVGHTNFWDDMVEQYDSAQLDFVAIWLKGDEQVQGTPATFQGLVAAINKRGIASRLKISPFDDNPASWCAQWNFDNGRGYSYAQPFDLSNTNLWNTYIWNNNFLVYFQSVPDANRLKINGRPVISIWSLAPAFVVNVSGNASKMLTWLRGKCQSTFGFNPYICVPQEWTMNDMSSNDPNIIDAIRPWFVPNVGSGQYASWNTQLYNGTTLGCAVPGYHGGAATDFSLWIDPNHGMTLSNALQHTVGASALTWVEGFDDMWEATTCWRSRNLDTSGNASYSYQQMGYQDYPNQRINMLRKLSNNPFPTDLKEEAEVCDTFSGGVGGGYAANYFRNGAISIYPCTDTYGGYYVGNIQTGETLQWQEVPLQNTFHINLRVATANANGSLHFVIDGTAHASVSLPNTGGLNSWQTVDAGSYTFPANSYHTVQLVFENGGYNVNFWQLSTTNANPTSAPPTPTGLAANPGNGQVSVSWNSSSGATGYNLKRSTTSGSGFTTIAPNYGGLNYTDNAVTNGTTYYYEISATNSFGESTNSTQVSATPSALASLVAWYKADAITGVNNGSGLGTWTDSSGNSHNATQGNAGLQPTYVTGAMNSLPVVRFTSANSTYLSLSRVIQDDFTIICVYQSGQGIGMGTAFFSGAGLVNAEVAGTQNDFGTSLNANGQILAGTGTPDTSIASGTGFADTKPHVFTFKRVESSGAITLYVDGNLVATNAAGTQPLTTPTQIVLGAQQTLVNYLSGDIAEVKIYNSALSDSARQTDENGLITKYGIGGAVTPPPPTPTGLSATAGNAQIVLSWNSSSGATGYNLKRSLTSGSGFVTIVPNLSTTSYTNTGLANGTTYYYEISATNSFGESTNSSQVSATPTLPPPPPTPTGLSATPGNAQVVLKWNSSAGATGYNLKRSLTSGSGYSTILPNYAGTNYTNGSLANGTTYYYEVSATNSFGESTNSAFVSATPSAGGSAPSIPTGLSATPGNAQVALTWNPSATATGYNLKRSLTSGGTYVTIFPNYSGTNYTDGGLANGTAYYYEVSATNSFGESANSSFVSATPSAGSPSAPPTPTHLAATAGNAQIALSWLASANATGYNLKRSTTSGSGYVTIAPNFVGVNYVDTNLANGTTYYYVVSATNSFGESANSGQVSATPTSASQGPPVTLAWTPSGNPTQPSDDLWSDPANWNPNGVPNTNTFANVSSATPCIVDYTAGTAVCNRMNIADGGGSTGVLIVTNGGVLTPLFDYCSIGYAGNATMDVENGSSATFPVHLWIGFNTGSVGTLIMNGGTVTVLGMYGAGWNGGVGHTHVNGGTLNLHEWSPSGPASLGAGSTLDIRQGTVNINGNYTTSINAFVSSNQITAYGGTGTVNVNFNGSQTVITATSPGGGNPQPQNIFDISSSGGHVTVTYATSAGFTYHLESSTTLAPASWSTVAGSTTNNVSGSSVTITFTAPAATQYYRAVSP